MKGTIWSDGPWLSRTRSPDKEQAGEHVDS